MIKALIVGGDLMVISLGRLHNVVGYTTIVNPDVVIFTDGVGHIPPAMYGQTYHPETSSASEMYRYASTFQKFSNTDVPMIGFGRGAHFLNVKFGGDLYQFVDNHIGEHDMKFLPLDEDFAVPSNHTQMMIAGLTGQVLGIAKESSVKEKMPYINKDVEKRKKNELKSYKIDQEVIVYPEQRALCLQPNVSRKFPEWNALAFDLIKKLL